MTDRAVPLNLGKGTHLRFDRGDIEALETAFSTICGRRVGYPEFPDFRHSLTGNSLFVWRGLRMEDKGGKLIHVFPLNVQGSEEAGEAVFAFIQAGNSRTLDDAVVDALVATGLWGLKSTEEKQQDPSEEKGGPKNSPA